MRCLVSTPRPDTNPFVNVGYHLPNHLTPGSVYGKDIGWDSDRHISPST